MAEYSDLGQYIMKLFDELIAVSKRQMNEDQKLFVSEVPRRVSSRTSISIMHTERFVREMGERLIRINQDLLNQYAISIAKKARSANKNQSLKLQTTYEELQKQLERKEEEIQGLQAHSKSLEQKKSILEKEKEETLQQFSRMSSTISELETRLTGISEECTQHLNQLNAEWEEKFQKNQEEWESYVKLKLAEREISTTTETSESE
ncbi:MAG: hypothetical protein ACXAC8_04630 [Candidatus Hodarchaeales archaeon]|jgi:chromosome segregation ATPase